MLGNLSYYNPTKLYFGDESFDLTKENITEILKESM